MAEVKWDKKKRPMVRLPDGKIHYSGLNNDEVKLLRKYGIDPDRIDVVLRRDAHSILFEIGGNTYLVNKEDLANG